VSYAEWTARWWQWFLTSNGRDPSVYYVKGRMVSPNDKQIHTTYNVIDHDEAILIPIDNWISFGFNEEKMRQVAKERMDRVIKLQLVVDSKSVVITERIVSPAFDIEIKSVPRLEITGMKPGKYKALSDGYWLFLEPNELEKGSHKIETLGSCATGLIQLEIHHSLEIK
jgi:hypothetical protein